ncbi:hypothetical protein FSARC_5505 [Fusarium sarcochroum]|uniref:Nucleoside phosphorylase domain-containing protein n=1 Tax=Fusarium sarcochroum TaxID=1208366 RepID=A0A8H4TZJ8_9HYPO|nr:hypothetical protein FSARC_5505 [Fusarium sarcochroum]
MTTSQRQFPPETYTVGWICALPIELAAAKAMLDHVHESLAISADDSNAYIMGDMAGHNVVMACLPASQYGTSNAATVANNMHRSFPSIQFRLMVGIGGGVPGKVDIRLGDVVVSYQVLQYDLGKTVQDGKFQRTGTSVKSPQPLLTVVSKLQANHALKSSEIPKILSEMIEKHPMMTEYARRDTFQDQLFDSTYDHINSMDTCDPCSASRAIQRPLRLSTEPKIHYGVIASGNQVMKHGRTRDKLAQESGAICFEMEAAGLMDHFQCLVIRGICDYSDSHKNKEWQKYAAATAAAYVKELFSIIPPDITKRTPKDNAGKKCLYPYRYSLLIAIDRRKRLLRSLPFDYIDSRRSTVKTQHSNTCEWLLTHADYLDWSNQAKANEHHGFLWIKGKPGAGKSTIMNFAYGQASEDKSHTVISFFFNARGSDLEQSVIGMHRALLFQLLNAIPNLLKVFDSSKHEKELNILWKDLKQQKTHAPWSVEILRSLLRVAVEKLGERRLTCFIDALDECAEDEVEGMVEYFEGLGVSAVAKGTHFRICFSSRHYPHVDIQHGLKLVLELQQGHGNDIALYIQQKLKMGRNKTSNEIRRKMQTKAGGIFMWVVLVVGILNMEYKSGRIFAVRKRLDTIPTELSDLFKEILSRDQKNLEDLKLCIQWILFARRPLELEEYYFAVVSGLNHEELSEWIKDELSQDDMHRFLLSSSKGLAEVTNGTTQTVQFIHESVREFFLKNGLQELWPDLKGDFECFSHDQLKNCCYTYIQLNAWACIPPTTEGPLAPSNGVTYLHRKSPEKAPFLDYAIQHVLYHANAAASEISQEHFLSLFNLRAWINIDNLLQRSLAHTPDASLIYLLAEKNYERLIASAQRLDPRIMIPGERYGYPLFVALANGHRKAVDALLQETSVDLENRSSTYLPYGQDFASFGYQSPLQWAMKCGHVLFAERLISSTEFRGNLPSYEAIGWLFKASERGSTDIVKSMLAVEGIDVNARNLLGETPLSRAASYGRYTTVGLLLGAEGLQVNLPDYSNRMALIRAAEIGHYEIVELLLSAEGIWVNFQDDFGKTALTYAIEIGREDIADLLSMSRGH